MSNMPDMPATVRVRDLADSFARLGIMPGDTVLMHSSLSSLGRMDGGADGAIDALLAAVGPHGHAIVPTHSPAYVLPGRSLTPYDPFTSPSKTGLITEVFRCRPNAFRSGHPTHSVAAIGPRAQELVSGHGPGGPTFNIAGPHGRYVRCNAKILFLGVGLASNTTYHAVEEWLDLPYMPDTLVAIARPGGPAADPLVVTTNSPCGHRSFYRNSGLDVPCQVNDTMMGQYARRTQCGPAELLLVWARDVVRVTVEHELRRPGCLLCEQLDCSFCRLARHHCLKQRARTEALAGHLLSTGELCDPTHECPSD